MKGHFSFVVLEGFEPSQAEPESDVLPLHHRTIPNCGCKGTVFFVTTKKKMNFFSKKIILFLQMLVYQRVTIFDIFDENNVYSKRMVAVGLIVEMMWLAPSKVR